MEFGFRCVTIPSTQSMSGNLSRSSIFYPDADTLIKNYQRRDRMVAWMEVYTEDIGSDNYFAEGKYEVVGVIPLKLANALATQQGYISHENGKDYLELNSRVLEIMRIWKYGQ